MSVQRDAQALRDASAAWRDMGRHLEEVVRGLDHQVGNARATHWQGQAAEAFTQDWTRLRNTVDDALPVFELAAAGLDSSADRMEQARLMSESAPQDESAGTDRPDSADRGSVQDSGTSGYHVAYALTALSQTGAALSSSFGRGRNAAKGSRRGMTSGARSVPQSTAEAPGTTDPFGPPQVRTPAKEKPRGGLGIARGRRGPARGPDGEAPGEPLSPEAAGAGPEPGPAPVQQPAPERGPAPVQRPAPESGPAPAQRPAPESGPAPAQRPAPDANPEPGQRPSPDTHRHGAFG